MIRTLITRALAVAGVAALAAALAGAPAHATTDQGRPLHAHTIHDGPYTYSPIVAMAGHGYTTDLVSFHGNPCRGHVTYASILAVTDNGGEEAEPASIRPGHLSFGLQFDRGDAGSWVVTGLSFSCSDGSSGQYDGQHPRITVS